MKLNAARALFRSVVKDALYSLKAKANFLRLDLPSGAIVDRSVKVVNPERIVIEPGANIAKGVSLRCSGGGKIIIRRNALVGQNVVLVTEDDGVIEIGEGTNIENNVFMRTKNKIKIGERNEVLAYSSIEPREEVCGQFVTAEKVTINAYNFIDTAADITIGAETHTGPYCMFYTHNHNFERAGSIWEQGIRTKAIRLGTGIWMGSRVMVMPGASVGDGCVIAASSVVTHEFDADDLIVGIPARTIRKRVI
jgi:acetyltransferase-like isoleucine patch superfamily enzyme